MPPTIEQHAHYTATVRSRRDIGLDIRPETEALEGKRVVVRALWQIEADDSRYPGEWAMQLPEGTGLHWIASGDLAEWGWSEKERSVLEAAAKSYWGTT